MFLSDHETAVDLLYYDAVAKTVVKLIHDSKKRPITIGVHGDWGAGKSSVLAMTEKQLSAQERTMCLRFNGWQFQGFEDAKAALIETIITSLRDSKRENEGIQTKAASLLRRVDYLKLVKKGAPWAFSLLTGIPHPEQVKDAVSLLKGLAEAAQGDLTIDKVKEAIAEAEGLLKPEQEKKIPEQMQAFHREFSELLDAVEIDKLVVLIDDLDRCLPSTAIETLEAIRLFLFAPRTAFIIAADEAMIEYAVRQHFPDLPASSSPTSYARYYLEKLIQVPFRIPALGYVETQIYVALILMEAALGEDDPRFKQLLPRARQCLLEPWKVSVLDHGVAKTCLGDAKLGDVPTEIGDAINLSQQISDILTDGSKGNPRQIKRFLNSLLLRNEVATVRGLSDHIKKPFLAKIMLAEAFNPAFYDQLTRTTYSHLDGKPRELGALEQRLRVQVTTEDAEKRDETAPKSADEWLKSDWIRNWAKSEPQLGDVDLRAYMFVTRDKRSYFGGAAGTSHLDPIVDALLGKELAVRSVEPQLSKLTQLEAEQVFDATQLRIVQADDYSLRPFGLIALTKVHPTLQTRLLEFLKGIPAAKVPGWVTTGFEKVFVDTSIKAELTATIQRWVEKGESKQLKAAAQMVSKRPRKG